MASKKALMLLAIAGGAYYLYTSKKGPIVTNMQGQVVDQIACGNSIVFDVPGYNRIWLSQLKDGQLRYDAPFDLPMPAYILLCPDDVGQYEMAVYELMPDDTKGALIGQTNILVIPQS